MVGRAQFLNPAEAARRLGVSTKALRLYEQRGLIEPVRTAAGWRTYGPAQMARATEIVALRALGLSLVQVAEALQGDPACLETALAEHQARLEGRARELADTLQKVRALRARAERGEAPATEHLTQRAMPAPEAGFSFDLPWPWGGERFELRNLRPLTYITGPLGSGKARLARKIADSTADAVYLGIERSADDGAAARTRIDNDPALKSRVDQVLAWLIENGAVMSPALVTLLVELEADDAAFLVVDAVEQGLDQRSQQALMAHLRGHRSSTRVLFLLTRSSSILDLTAVGADEGIILCPANHSPPIQILPYPGTPGYEAVATCLASPEVRARTAGMRAMLPRSA